MKIVGYREPKVKTCLMILNLQPLMSQVKGEYPA